MTQRTQEDGGEGRRDAGRTVTPLDGVRVVEFAALGPVEHAGMLLADLGAEVTIVLRPGQSLRRNVMLRGRRPVELDLKSESGRIAALDLLAAADVLLEGLRPGVMERLRLGPADVAATNPRIVYARMTGWGQNGPLAARAGHDINYIAESGVLWTNRRPGEPPTIPANMLGDNGGGSAFLVIGVLAALLERERSGRGAVIDAAIVDGTASLLQTLLGFRAEKDPAGAEMLSDELPWYTTYACADGGWFAVGAVEPQFYAQLLRGLGVEEAPDRDDPANRPALRQLLASRFRTRTRDEWAVVFEGLDACATPVRTPDEAFTSPHLRARGTYYSAPEGWSAAPAPRLLPLPTQEGPR